MREVLYPWNEGVLLLDYFPCELVYTSKGEMDNQMKWNAWHLPHLRWISSSLVFKSTPCLEFMGKLDCQENLKIRQVVLQSKMNINIKTLIVLALSILRFPLVKYTALNGLNNLTYVFIFLHSTFLISYMGILTSISYSCSYWIKNVWNT